MSGSAPAGRYLRDTLLDSQTATLTAAAEAKGYRVEASLTRANRAARSATVPGCAPALDRLDRGEAAALFALDLDRLSRSVADFSRMLDRATRKGWAVIVLGLGAVDTTTAEGRLVAQMLAAAAEYERAMVSKRVKRQHEARRARGEVWGVTAGNRPEVAAEVREEILTRHKAGHSLNGIAADLNDRAVPTARGGRWHASTVRHIVTSPAALAA
jgi:DNA invertase Pin-like site-specific DNA recombinase